VLSLTGVRLVSVVDGRLSEVIKRLSVVTARLLLARVARFFSSLRFFSSARLLSRTASSVRLLSWARFLSLSLRELFCGSCRVRLALF
jgi:hypothetical protein